MATRIEIDITKPYCGGCATGWTRDVSTDAAVAANRWVCSTCFRPSKATLEREAGTLPAR